MCQVFVIYTEPSLHILVLVMTQELRMLPLLAKGLLLVDNVHGTLVYTAISTCEWMRSPSCSASHTPYSMPEGRYDHVVPPLPADPLAAVVGLSNAAYLQR